jgi:hypothetical protein
MCDACADAARPVERAPAMIDTGVTVITASARSPTHPVGFRADSMISVAGRP